MKMECHAIFLLQRLNLVPRDYIILDRTYSFHGIWVNSLENLRKLSVYKKILSPIKLDEKAGILRCGQVEAIIRFRKNMMTERSFYY